MLHSRLRLLDLDASYWRDFLSWRTSPLVTADPITRTMLIEIVNWTWTRHELKVELRISHVKSPVSKSRPDTHMSDASHMQSDVIAMAMLESEWLNVDAWTMPRYRSSHTNRNIGNPNKIHSSFNITFMGTFILVRSFCHFRRRNEISDGFRKLQHVCNLLSDFTFGLSRPVEASRMSLERNDAGTESLSTCGDQLSKFEIGNLNFLADNLNRILQWALWMLMISRSNIQEKYLCNQFINTHFLVIDIHGESWRSDFLRTWSSASAKLWNWPLKLSFKLNLQVIFLEQSHESRLRIWCGHTQWSDACFGQEFHESTWKNILCPCVQTVYSESDGCLSMLWNIILLGYDLAMQIGSICRLAASASVHVRSNMDQEELFPISVADSLC